MSKANELYESTMRKLMVKECAKIHTLAALASSQRLRKLLEDQDNRETQLFLAKLAGDMLNATIEFETAMRRISYSHAFAGMTRDELLACMSGMDDAQAHHMSRIFNEPVCPNCGSPNCFGAYSGEDMKIPQELVEWLQNHLSQ